MYVTEQYIGNIQIIKKLGGVATEHDVNEQLYKIIMNYTYTYSGIR